MNADEYYRKQEELIKIFNLKRSEQDKNEILRQMLIAEMKFLTENKPIKTPQESSLQDDQGNTHKLPYKGAKPKVDSKDGSPFINTIKMTPDNIISHIKATHENGEDKDMLIEALKNTKFAQKLCESLNKAALSQMKEIIGDDLNQYEKFDDGEHIGYRKDPAHIKNKKEEAESILNRAAGFKTSMAKQSSNTEASVDSYSQAAKAHNAKANPSESGTIAPSKRGNQT